MSDSEDQPVEIELYEEIADERYSTPEGSRSSSPHQLESSPVAIQRPPE